MAFRPKQRATQAQVDDMNQLFRLISRSREPELRGLARSFDSKAQEQRMFDPSNPEHVVGLAGSNSGSEYQRRANEQAAHWRNAHAANRERTRDRVPKFR